MTLPNFLIVGSTKCGTTSVYRYLRDHPQVFMPARKEPYFFVRPKRLLGTGPGTLGRGLMEDVADYRALFAPATGTNASAVGEASAGYLYFHSHTIPGIKDLLGDPRIIIMLRDPCERAFSCHLHHIRNGLEPLSFEAALEAQTTRKEKNWWFGYQLIDVGLYHAQVKAFLSAFPNVSIGLIDDLGSQPREFMKGLYEFLGIDNTYEADLSTRHNVSLLPKRQRWHRFLTKPGLLARVVRKGTGLVGLKRPLARVRDALVARNLGRPKLKPETRARLIRIYREDVLRLQDLIDRDLGSWLE